ncbi:MAG: hypothetical protein HC892_10400 [Saprospiraceae bacterium]|nr:hypothetical protein [Saprospiraceae bacterium]
MILLDISSFVGRFHPLVVHLPIGFLLLAIVFEWLSQRWQLGKAASVTWLLGAISALPAIVCGWMLASEGGYDDDTLFWHRWLGVGVGIAAFVAWLLKSNILSAPRWATTGVSVGILGLLTVVGHLGGNMTHGSDYLLEHAPKPVKLLLGSVEKIDSLPQWSEPDSVKVYANLIEPIFAIKCMQCHNNEVQRGGLNMASAELLQEGGDNGPVLTSGNALESELYKRVVLPNDHPKYMPLKGTPMTYQEIRLMEWWINAGGSFEDKLTTIPLTKDVQNIITRLFGLDLVAKPYYEKVKVVKTSEEVVQQLNNQGFKVKFLASDNYLLDVKMMNGVEQSQLQSLLQVKDKITWLDLSSTNASDDWLKIINQFENLTRLELAQNPISDQGIEHLLTLKHLETLNLYSTNVTNQVLETLKKIPTLKRLYLWQTQVTEDAIADLERALPSLDVDGGANLVQAETN